ncbi:MAG: hypothetical protein ACAH95_10835 [Fimbriimonas sp.]
MADAAIDKSTEELIGRIRLTGGLFAKDLSASTHEMLANLPGGKARSGYDIAYEVTGLNRLVAAKALGQSFDGPSGKGWVRAPEDARDKEVALRSFEESVDAVCSALAQMPVERQSESCDTPLGPLPLIRLAGIIPNHQMYHSGQLNYIQTLHGDEESHW